MLKNIFKKDKRNVYLGSLAVAPRSDIKKHFDERELFGREDLDSSLRLSLEKIFDLPYARDVANPKSNDLGLDVVVPKFQSGAALGLSAGEVSFPLIWRPRIEVSSRLFSLKTHKTIHTQTIVKKMPWSEYFSRLFSLRTHLQLKPAFDSHDMDKLLHFACLELLSQLKKVV